MEISFVKTSVLKKSFWAFFLKCENLVPFQFEKLFDFFFENEYDLQEKKNENLYWDGKGRFFLIEISYIGLLQKNAAIGWILMLVIVDYKL